LAPCSQKGFTLLEMMVVTVLIAITITFVTLELQQDDNQIARLEARRFLALLEQLREESVLQAKVLAVTVDSRERSYRFDVVSDSSVALDGDIFRQRKLPETLDLQLEVAKTADTTSQPVVLVFPDGSISGFALSILGETQQYSVVSDTAGNLDLTSAVIQ